MARPRSAERLAERMIKIVALIKRRADLTREEFTDYYEHRHAPLFHRVIPTDVSSAIIRYVQNHAVALGRGNANTPYDCVTEIGFSDLDGFRVWNGWYLGEDGLILREDERNFMDVDKRVVIVTEEHDIGVVV